MSGKKSKLELIMELADKLFNNKLSQVQAKLSGATDKMEGKLQRFNMKQIKVFSNIGETFDPVKINQMTDLFDNVSEKLDFSNDISNVQTALQQMDVSNVDEISAKIHKISKIFNEDSIEIAKAANAMTKQIGGSFESNLALLEAGFEKGANLNDDMIDQFKEYGPQMRELGLDASQMLAIMAKAGKDGLFSDKAIDSIKEANLSLKEIGPAQLDALKGIGINFEKDLKDKTSFEAVQLISKAMNGATAQAKQLALTDIFKGAGEDAGMGFILGLGTMELDPNKIPSFANANKGFKSWVADLQSSIAENVGGWMPLINSLGMGGMAISGIISLGGEVLPILGKLAKVTKLTAAAQWLLNIATTAFPVVAIIVGITALIALVVVAIKKWDDWGAAIMLFLGPIGMVISAFKSLYDHWDSIKQAFQTDGIVGGLKRIGLVLLDAVLKPLQQVLEGLASFDPTGLAQKGADKLKAFREGNKLVTPGELNPDIPKPVNPVAGAPVNPLLKSPVIDGKLTPDDKKKKQGENVNRVAGEANQIRKIDIKIDSFNKGGINVAQSAYAGMTKEDLEAWFKEMLRRVVINAETA